MKEAQKLYLIQLPWSKEQNKITLLDTEDLFVEKMEKVRQSVVWGAKDEKDWRFTLLFNLSQNIITNNGIRVGSGVQAIRTAYPMVNNRLRYFPRIKGSFIVIEELGLIFDLDENGSVVRWATCRYYKD